MAKTGWFETVAEAQRRAQKRLPPVCTARWSPARRRASPSPTTSRRSANSASPRTSPGLSGKRDLATTVMGQSISLPVIISPTGVQAVHPDGEVAVARAAAARGTAMGLSSFASKPIEEVAAANPQTFFQMYWTGGRGQAGRRAWSAPAAAGAVGLIITRTGRSPAAATGAARPSRRRWTCGPCCASPPRASAATLAARVRQDRPCARPDGAQPGRRR